jgi:hypothetical protein
VHDATMGEGGDACAGAPQGWEGATERTGMVGHRGMMWFETPPLACGPGLGARLLEERVCVPGEFTVRGVGVFGLRWLARSTPGTVMQNK